MLKKSVENLKTVLNKRSFVLSYILIMYNILESNVPNT